ncbi:hypothetical protein HK100_000926 [Physocladia obscura]|uniref:Uncharacterized protein n=1 Tax=Physocladia obscura TaxID=109957 RepID=A0AAD5XC66_9FUNG|nr:hypothetical protein HK100_000926 [Physocladia obscura]
MMYRQPSIPTSLKRGRGGETENINETDFEMQLDAEMETDDRAEMLMMDRAESETKRRVVLFAGRHSGFDSSGTDTGFGFGDRLGFPDFDHLPDDRSLLDPAANIYWQVRKEGFVRPARHWCFLAEIAIHNNNNNTNSSIKSLSGSTSNVCIFINTNTYDNNNSNNAIVEFNSAATPQTFAWTDLQPGATLAILYAQRTTLNDGRSGVWVADLNKVFVFNNSLSNLKQSSALAFNSNGHNSDRQAVAVQWLLELIDSTFSGYSSFHWGPANGKVSGAVLESRRHHQCDPDYCNCFEYAYN